MSELLCPPCKLCGSHDTFIAVQPRISREDRSQGSACHPTVSDFGIIHPLAECRSCGFQFAAQADHAVGGAYSSSADACYGAQTEERSQTFLKVLSYLKTIVPPGARLLDVGCSYGLFLRLAREQGFQVSGIEPSADAARHCTDAGLDVSCGDMESAQFPAGSFDLITAFEVIEHLESPAAFIAKARSLLKPGGVFFLVTPDLGSFSRRVMGYRWFSYRAMHVSYFSKRTLKNFLGQKGFTVLGSFPYRKTFKVEYILRKWVDLNCCRCVPEGFLRVCAAIGLDKAALSLSFGDVAVAARKRSA